MEIMVWVTAVGAIVTTGFYAAKLSLEVFNMWTVTEKSNSLKPSSY
jgi:hypothetical protein